MKKAIIVLGAFIGLFFTSCGKMLVITPPNAIIDEQVNELLAQGGETAEQVINNFASPMPSYFDLTNIGIGSGSANPTTNSEGTHTESIRTAKECRRKTHHS